MDKIFPILVPGYPYLCSILFENTYIFTNIPQKNRIIACLKKKITLKLLGVCFCGD